MTERTILHACVLPRESMCARRCVLLCTRTPGHTRQVTRHVCMHICPRTGDTSPYECAPEPAQGLEEGIVGMRVGGIRKLTIPLELAPKGMKLPPDVPLIYEVTLNEVFDNYLN